MHPLHYSKKPKRLRDSELVQVSLFEQTSEIFPSINDVNPQQSIGRRFKNDTERLEKLFDLYTKLAAEQKKPPAKKKGTL